MRVSESVRRVSSSAGVFATPTKNIRALHFSRAWCHPFPPKVNGKIPATDDGRAPEQKNYRTGRLVR
jgi:hypothetical protein